MYELWQHAGFPLGKDDEFYLQAEEELLDEEKTLCCSPALSPYLQRHWMVYEGHPDRPYNDWDVCAAKACLRAQRQHPSRYEPDHRHRRRDRALVPVGNKTLLCG